MSLNPLIPIQLFMVLLLQTTGLVAAEAQTLEHAAVDAYNAKKNHKAFIVYVSSESCTYCALFEKDVMPALVNSESYQSKVIFRRIHTEDQHKLVDFGGKAISAQDFLSRYRIMVTPTLLFLNDKGEQMVKPLEGYRRNTFFWSYLDNNIEDVIKHLKQKDK